MKIAILSDDFPPYVSGGAGVVAGNVAFGLAGKGHDVYVVTTVQNKEKAGAFVENGVTIYRIYNNYDSRFRYYVSLYNMEIIGEVRSILEKIAPHITHIHNIHTYLSYHSLYLAKKYSKGVVITMHDVMTLHYGKLGALFLGGRVVVEKINPIKQFILNKFRYNPFRNILIKHYLSYVDKVLAVSEELKKVLVTNGIKNVGVLYNGIEVEKWIAEQSEIQDFKNKYGLEGKKVIFFGGRLSSAKGGVVAIRVLERVCKTVPNTVLVVAGEQNLSTNTMLETARKLGVVEKIVFIGWIKHEKVKVVYGSSDVVFVLSQYMDPFPTVNLEAMASKKPVVGTVFGGTAELVINNETGFVVDPRDIKEVSEKTIELLCHPENSRVFGERGYSRVATGFSYESWINKTIVCYSDILKNK